MEEKSKAANNQQPLVDYLIVKKYQMEQKKIVEEQTDYTSHGLDGMQMVM